MHQEQSLNMNLSQHLAMTMKLQQAIQILQLSAQDLKAEIEKEYLENPALEIVSDPVGRLEGGEWEGQVWLRHNQGILFDHLPAGMKYTITEVPAGYICDRENNKAEGRIPNLEGDNEEMLVRERFTNTKTETPPTGINLQTTVPMLGILLASLLLAVVFCGKRRESR